jgi:hypothetical protein
LRITKLSIPLYQQTNKRNGEAANKYPKKMAIVTSNGNFLTLFTQPNGYTGGFFHDGKSLLRGCDPNEISFILETWGKDAPEGGIDPAPSFEEFEEERYIIIPELGVDMAIGPIENEIYGGWNCPYYEEE